MSQLPVPWCPIGRCCPTPRSTRPNGPSSRTRTLSLCRERATPEGVKLLCRRRRWHGEGVLRGDAMADRASRRVVAGSRRCCLSGEVEAFELEEVEGVDVPEHDRLDLLLAAHQQLSEASVAHMGMRPFGGKAPSIKGHALLADHALPPGDGARFVASLGGCRVTLAFRQGTEQLDVQRVQLLDVVLAGVTAIGQHPRGLHIIALLDLVQCRLQQAMVGATVGD